MDSLRVRLYNVRFGDAILVSFPEEDGGDEVVRHILIDVGNILGTAGGSDAVFEPIVRNVLEETGGQPVDLYVMTHEHLDHVQGLFHAHEKSSLDVTAEYAWLTASSHPTYYETHEEARKGIQAAAAMYERIGLYLSSLGTLEEIPPPVDALLANNDALMGIGGNPSSTKECVDFLRSRAPAEKTFYVHRETDVSEAHPFTEAKIELWGPEEDTAVYYGRFQPAALQPLAVDATAGEPPALAEPKPPRGVDAGAFYNLVEMRKRGYLDNLLAIDRAANNTSVVFCLEWRGWKLLFPGDAEERSWREMDKRGLLQTVHFFKVGHHGSHNGTPDEDLLEKLLPLDPPDDRPRFAAVSTFPGSYNNVPDDDGTLARLEARCELRSTLSVADGEWIDLEFAAQP